MPAITSTPTGNQVPVTTSDDILAVVAQDLNPDTPAIVRDAIIAMLVVIFTTYQEKADYASAQSDLLRATGTYLRGLCADRGIFPTAADTDDTLRSRAISIPELVTPAAIMALVNSILSNYTTKTARYFELPSDGSFISTGFYISTSPTPPAFSTFIGMSPMYQDRLYDNPNNLSGVNYGTIPYKCSGRDPLRARINADSNGRMFELLIPFIGGDDVQHLFTSNENGAGTLISNAFVYNGSNTAGNEAAGNTAAFTFADRLLSTEVYQLIATTVQQAKGQGIRWILYVDPSL